MKNLIWITSLILAFAAGYFTRDMNQDELVVPQQTAPLDQTRKIGQPQISTEQLSTAAQAALVAKENNSIPSNAAKVGSNKLKGTSSIENPASLQAPMETAENNNEKASPKEISDEEIDTLLQPPYSTALKSTHGPLREKYKEFSESTKQDSWDINMQNKITDFLLGNAYSKFINLESVTCKINFCEVRAIELKSGATNLMTAEMSMQEWWDIGPSQWTTRRTENGKGSLYMLLQKK